MQLNDRQINILLLLAMVSALLGAVADMLLLYNPEGGYETGDYLFYLDIPKERMFLGHYLGIIFIPLELLGMFHIYRAIKHAPKGLVFTLLMVSIYTVFPGVVYHGSCAFAGSLIQLPETYAAADAILAEEFTYWKGLFEPLGAMLMLGSLLISILFAIIVLRGKTAFPKWMAWCSPMVFYLLFFVLYFTVPVIGNILIPAGFNLSFFLFFLCSWVAWRNASPSGRAS